MLTVCLDRNAHAKNTQQEYTTFSWALPSAHKKKKHATRGIGQIGTFDELLSCKHHCFKPRDRPQVVKGPLSSGEQCFEMPTLVADGNAHENVVS